MRGAGRAILLATLTAVLAAAAFFVAPPVDAQQRLRVGVFLASAANTYWTAALQGVRDAANRHGNVELTVFDGQFDTIRQTNQLRDALVGRRFQAWFIGPNDGGPLTPVIRQAIQQEVKVACTLVPCGPDIRSTRVQIPGLVAQIGVGFFENGQLLGRLTTQACAGRNPCNVFWLPGLPELPLERARTDGLMSVLRQNPHIRVVAVQPGGYLAAPALTATQNVLQAQRNVHVIVSSGDQMIDGAYRAARAMGMAANIRFVGNGCTFQAVRAIREGRQFACAVYLPRTEARLAADMMIRAARGERIQNQAIDPLRFSPVGPMVTRDNVDRFEPEFDS
jgi:ribose transport system substrate-binding protein